jgi:cation diffusion facilitator CzcD-associated flavoprotein CzcO
VGYQFTWRTKIWSHYYSYSPEIFEYLKGIYEENDFINKYVKLKHQIEHAQWDATKGVWKFRVRDLASDTVVEDEAEFFINAGGVLNKWKWPEVSGLHDYKGKLMHSAAYEEGYPLEGKRVAVIGAGSSGVQIVANIQKKGELKQSDLNSRQDISLTSSLAAISRALVPLGTKSHLDNSRLWARLGWHERCQLRIHRCSKEIPGGEPQKIPGISQATGERVKHALQIHHQRLARSQSST